MRVWLIMAVFMGAVLAAEQTTIKLISSAFAEGGNIPSKFTVGE